MAASVLALAVSIVSLLPVLSLWPLVPPQSLAAVANRAPDGPAARNRPLSALALRLQRERDAVVRDETSRAIIIFGIPATESRMLFLPVDRLRALPEGYEPPDLTWVGGRQVREIARPDLLSMIQAAEADDVEIAPVSAYRGPDEQALAFESAVWGAMARRNQDRATAEQEMARFVAPPGHSQHQLGTAVDFSTWEINYAVQPRFAETDAGRWLEAHAWEYGFVLSYTRQGEARSGYAYEPWHYRWIGKDLAAILQRDGYLDHPTTIVDDYLRATEEILAYEGIP
jgi:D-alanyl-D-alanine carboxypeptidase